MSTKRKSMFLKTTVFFVMFLCLLVSSFGLKTAQAASARKLNSTKKSIEEGKTFTLKVYNLQSGDTVKYATSDKEIVAISSKGVCRGVTPGEAIVAATITDKNKNKVKLTCKVTVKEMRIPTISDVTLTKDGDFIIGTSSVALSFKVDKTTTATISVCDSFHEAVYAKTVNVTENKTTKFTWDGLNNSGKDVAADTYYIRVDSDNAMAKSDPFVVADTSDFSKGNGSAKNPYQIKTLEELRKIAAHNNSHFILMNDIDAAYESVQNMFTKDVPFNGTLDGNGKTIKNLLNTTSMFNALGENAVITNLKFSNANMVASADSGIIAHTNNGLIEKCTISNVAITGMGGGYGVFVAFNSGTIKNCKSDGKLAYSRGDWSGLYNGGIVAVNQATGKVMNCSSSVNISVGSRDKWAGGIVGRNYGMIVSCTFSGTSLGTSAGAIAENNSGTIMSCSYLGNQEGLNIVFSSTGTVK